MAKKSKIPEIQPLTDSHQLLTTLRQVREEVYREGQAQFKKWCPLIQRRSFMISGLNLAYYLALRHRDLREIQEALPPLGLSSFGHAEAQVLQNLDAVIAALAAITDAHDKKLPARPSPRAFTRGQRMLTHNTDLTLGHMTGDRQAHIMVTFPTEAADDYGLVLDLVKRGMTWARINCAHDDANVWESMIENVHKASVETGIRCRILMDLGGPKVRTGKVLPKKAKVKIGDSLLLTRRKPKALDKYPIQVQCMIPEAIDQLVVNDKVWIDDGTIGTQVEAVNGHGAVLRVIYAYPQGGVIRSEKGLNFPDTELEISPLTMMDYTDLKFIAAHADAVGYSFVQTAEDVKLLQEALIYQHIAPKPLTIIAKIETRRAVENLPEIIVQAAGTQNFAVMIARGDLAVEIGFQRLAEIQEEIMWICEAAHVPVIWATQVLETLVKTGIPTRAEITDAAMADRAECVMLNKGPFIGEAVTVLADVLRRMQAHHAKNMVQLRELHSW